VIPGSLFPDRPDFFSLRVFFSLLFPSRKGGIRLIGTKMCEFWLLPCTGLFLFPVSLSRGAVSITFLSAKDVRIFPHPLASPLAPSHRKGDSPPPARSPLRLFFLSWTISRHPPSFVAHSVPHLRQAGESLSPLVVFFIPLLGSPCIFAIFGRPSGFLEPSSDGLRLCPIFFSL